MYNAHQCSVFVLLFQFVLIAQVSSSCLSGIKQDFLRNLINNISEYTTETLATKETENRITGITYSNDIPNWVHDFALAASIPGVRNICEMGSNSGHLVAVFLSSNFHSRLVSFDVNDSKRSKLLIDYIHSLFPNRFTSLQGIFKIKDYAAINSNIKCDLWSIDFNSTGNEFQLEDTTLMSTNHSLILRYASLSEFPNLQQSWQRWEEMGQLRTVYCHLDNFNTDNTLHRGWCLGKLNFKVLNSSLISSTKTFNRTCLPSVPPMHPSLQHNVSVIEGKNISSFNLWISCRYLVYTVLGADRRFNEMAEMMVKSLFACILRSPPVCQVDIYILTDRGNFAALEPLVRSFGVKLFEVPLTNSSMASSMTKLQVFNLSHIRSYTAAFYLDVDVLVNLKDLDEVITQVLKEPHKLHVFRESPSAKDFLVGFYGLGRFMPTPEEIESFQKRNITPFNAGLFMFQPNDVMRRHFKRVLDIIADYKGPYFYEQSFLNYYFPRQNAVEYSLSKFERVVPLEKERPIIQNETSQLLHFSSSGDKRKALRMSFVMDFYMPWVNATLASSSLGSKEKRESMVEAVGEADGSGLCSHRRWVHRTEMRTTDCEIIVHKAG